MNPEKKFIVIGLALTAALYVFFLSIPLFGDTLGYGFATTNWIRDNGYTPLATGEGRGEQAMGHPTLFFWLWALLSGLLGNTPWVARLLPAVATFLSIWGMYRLGRLLSCEMAGWLSALALLASPLFIIQSMRPMPESAVVAAVIWSLFFFAKKDYIRASILCALAIAFKEQAVLLAGSLFIAEFIQSGVKKPHRLLLLLSPILVFFVTGLLNLAANGYFFFPTHIGEGSQLEPNWLLIRLRLFGIHLISEDFRWLLVTAALAGMIRGTGRDTDRRLLPFILILLFPSLFFPPARIAFLVFVAALLAVYTIRHRLVLGRLFTAFIMLPVSFVMFHVLIVLISPDSTMNLFRYVLPAYPAIILGPMVMLFKYYSRKTAIVIGSIFVVSTAVANRLQHYDYQSDTSLACIQPLQDYKEAVLYGVSLEDTMLVSGINRRYYSFPECGIVESPVPVRNISSDGQLLEENTYYTLVIASFMDSEGSINISEDILPPGSELRLLSEPRWDDGRNTVKIFRVEPRIQ
ncbi:MAG: glycosyltransferase family 39 protein [Candidatus Sabulitectum sp.]|nr:glycosyltransferase family 39 protein [Candidatus Sabulitectum sp.]